MLFVTTIIVGFSATFTPPITNESNVNPTAGFACNVTGVPIGKRPIDGSVLTPPPHESICKEAPPKKTPHPTFNLAATPPLGLPDPDAPPAQPLTVHPGFGSATRPTIPPA